MIALVQRVTEASVSVGERVTGSINRGFLILLGVSRDDTDEDLNWVVSKIAGLRVFSDEAGQMNLSLSSVSGEVLLVSQFTLMADCKKGNRPSFHLAADPEMAKNYYEKAIFGLQSMGIAVKTGEFGAFMQVKLVNDGPVTITLDSRDRGKRPV
ncbi:MAG: D-tyrosyl-tRNA(Tyr) deacylase [Candidatus Cloacimonetes bacterium]|nr:D-tyrosyl-tRNA(Tyr) deacylase [Candidatus Cloacimonadota bacterium]